MSLGRSPVGRAPLRALADRAVTQPIAVPVPADDAAFRASKGDLRLAQRLLKRRAEVWRTAQTRHEVTAWNPAWRRVVWFHGEMPQLGDSLLDLAPRSLLAECGLVTDVVLPPFLAGVYRGDRWFGRVWSIDAVDGGGDGGRGAGFDAGAYDVALVDSTCGHALAWKVRHAPSLPWLSIRGDYLAYDYQRGMLATRRLSAVLGAALSPADELRHARQKLDIVDAAPAPAEAAGRIAVTLGGVQPLRTYRHWPAVVRTLAAAGHRRWTLLGSGNGEVHARAVRTALAQAVPDADVLDLVGRTTILATQQAMHAARALLCVDGGLMHLGCTTDTPMLGLFDATSLPAWRVPLDWTGTALVSATNDVNDLAPERVAATALSLAVLAAPRSPG